MAVGDTIINQTRDAVEARQREHLLDFEERQGSVRRIAAHIQANPSLSILMESPLLLSLADLVQVSHPHREWPETPTAFYQEMTRLLATGARRSGTSHSNQLLDASQLLDILPPVAWRLFSHDAATYRFSHDILLDTFCATGQSIIEAEKLVAHLLDLGIVERQQQGGVEQLEFCHESFRDFLAASYVASLINHDGWRSAEVDAWQPNIGWHKANVGQLLDKNAFEQSWEPLIIFTAGQIREPLSLITMLVDRRRDDIYRHRLGLLCRCYQALGAATQMTIASKKPSLFQEILRIAKRCEHDDMGHRKPWLEWVEALISSSAGIERLCDGLLALSGRYHGWAVELKVLELFERVLTRGKVPPQVVDAIARLAERDEHQWGINSARLALRLSEDAHKQQLVSHFMSILDNPETPDRIKIRISGAVATSGSHTAARRAGEILILLSQNETLPYENAERAVNELVPLLETSYASIVASLLINHLLNPSSLHHFWLAWRIIGRSEKALDSPWSAVFLTIILFADRENDHRLKLWAAEVLTMHPTSHLRDLGLHTLMEMAQDKNSHSWVYAARWLVEHGPVEFANSARKVLFDEALSQDSDQRRVAMAELLEMGAVNPLRQPVQKIVCKAVLQELHDHGQKYGSRLDVSVPGAPKENIDVQLFADNPAAVIKLLHTYNGPSPYLRSNMNFPSEEKRMRYFTAMLLHGTRYWPEVRRSSIQAICDLAGADPDRHDGALGIVLFAASGSELFSLLEKAVERGRSGTSTRHYLLEELNDRGWRFRFRGRQIEILRKGLEEPLAQSPPTGIAESLVVAPS